jgi:hypothetical protein
MWQKQADLYSKPRSGRPRIPAEQRDHVYEVVTHLNPYIIMRDLLRKVNDDYKIRYTKPVVRVGQGERDKKVDTCSSRLNTRMYDFNIIRY